MEQEKQENNFIFCGEVKTDETDFELTLTSPGSLINVMVEF